MRARERGTGKKEKSKREKEREKRNGEGGRCATVHVAPPKAFLEVAPRPGVDLMNGNVGIIVFTRGTHGCLSRHTWRGNIPFIKRSARSSHRRARTRRHTHTRTHARMHIYT